MRIERGQVDLVIEQMIERMLEGAGQEVALQIERDEARTRVAKAILRRRSVVEMLPR